MYITIFLTKLYRNCTQNVIWVFSSNVASASWGDDEEDVAVSDASEGLGEETEVAVCRSSGTEAGARAAEPSEAADSPRASPAIRASASSCGSGTRFWPEEQSAFKACPLVQSVKAFDKRVSPVFLTDWAWGLFSLSLPHPDICAWWRSFQVCRSAPVWIWFWSCASHRLSPRRFHLRQTRTLRCHNRMNRRCFLKLNDAWR